MKLLITSNKAILWHLFIAIMSVLPPLKLLDVLTCQYVINHTVLINGCFMSESVLHLTYPPDNCPMLSKSRINISKILPQVNFPDHHLLKSSTVATVWELRQNHSKHRNTGVESCSHHHSNTSKLWKSIHDDKAPSRLG